MSVGFVVRRGHRTGLEQLAIQGRIRDADGPREVRVRMNRSLAPQWLPTQSSDSSNVAADVLFPGGAEGI